jgi:hypothetical protein
MSMHRTRTALVLASIAALALSAAACSTEPRPSIEPAMADPAAPKPAQPAQPTAPAAPSPAAPSPGAREGLVRLGSPIDAAAKTVTLASVAKDPSAFRGKTFATTGTVTAVCQHMGCWMEIKDDASEAHVKMAGHSFFVPKDASGRKARVLATLETSDVEPAACAEEGNGDHAGHAGEAKKGCRAEAEAQLGHPLAKLELVAEGVELL